MVAFIASFLFGSALLLALFTIAAMLRQYREQALDALMGRRPIAVPLPDPRITVRHTPRPRGRLMAPPTLAELLRAAA